MRRLFACIRTAIVAPLFIALWMYFIPKWLAGGDAFAVMRPLGWLIVALGALVAVPSIAAFAWRGLGTPAVFDPPRKLVVSGPYRFVRNPMYTGFAIALIGEAIAYPNLARFMLGELAVFVALVWVFVMVYEEPVLRAKFGDAYTDYCAQVRRWIPRLTPFDNTKPLPYIDPRLD